ncbi:MAG: UDP-N-acetylmuramate dehydrogenase [Microgenomates group bacterium]
MDLKYKKLKYKKIIEFLGRDKVKFNEPLAAYTTFRIGGPADLFFEAETEEELVRTVREVKNVGIPYFILGGGSNVLVGDRGFRGIVIKVQSSKFKVQSYNSKVKVYAESGVLMWNLLQKCIENSLTGLEFMAGIPGTIGGAVRGNAGAWQQSFSDRVSRVKIFDEQGEVKWLKKEECNFSYRKSRFKEKREIVLAVQLEMETDDKEKVEKKIKEYLRRRATQPKEPSAGCIFVNPKPFSAGRLIEECGLKGTRAGRAQISVKHANFIVNLGQAKAREVVQLIDLAKKKVKERFSLDLEEEIVRIGEF